MSENIIYGLKGPDGVIRYVGTSTRSLAYRVNNHKNSAKRGRNTRVDKWVRELDFEVEGVVLEVVAGGGNVNEKANVWRRSLRRKGIDLLNQPERASKAPKPVKKARTYKPLTEAQKAAVSRAHKGKTVSAETRAKISAKAKGHLRNLGRVQSEATRLKMSFSKHRNGHLAKDITKDTCRWCNGDTLILPNE